MRPRDSLGKFIKTTENGRHYCTVEGCNRYHHTLGYCTSHLYRFRTYGDPNWKRVLKTKEEKRIRQLARQKVYKKSPEGKLVQRKYINGPAGKAANSRRFQKRLERMKLATPKTLSLGSIIEMKKFFKNRPKGFAVDHIHPLYGTNNDNEHISCGLHVPWNLQYLKISDNCKKGSKVPWL